MHATGLSLSESKVLQDAQFFTTKAAIDAKINTLFSELKNKIEASASVDCILPVELWTSPGRIYRGEHLGAFPWRALDCPRSFAGKDIFVFRTLLIWGNSFSFHLILSGNWVKRYARQLSREDLAEEGWLLSRQQSPWDWKLDDSSHQAVSQIRSGEWKSLVAGQDWLKISQSHPLSSFSEIPEIGANLWQKIAIRLQ